MLNFSLRPNKSVERRLIFERLRVLDSQFGFSSYRYIGLGSLWFVDFLHAHRVLGIEQFDSIEMEPTLAARADFNRPLGTITVHKGKSTAVLSTLALAAKRAIVWMDYTGGIDIAMPDLPILAADLPTGSIVLITINASRRTLGTIPSGTLPADVPTYWFEQLKARVGQFMPSGVTASSMQQGPPLSRALGHALLIGLDYFAAQRVAHRFEPLFLFHYADNAPMVTVGGMICDVADLQRIRDPLLRLSGAFTPSGSLQPAIEALDVPTLTTREKHALDKLLPSNVPLAPSMLPAALVLSQEELDNYRSHYTRYPTYLEVEIM